MKIILAFLEIMLQFYLVGDEVSAVNDSNAVKSPPPLFRQMIKRREVERGVSWILGLLSWLPPICEGEEGGTS